MKQKKSPAGAGCRWSVGRVPEATREPRAPWPGTMYGPKRASADGQLLPLYPQLRTRKAHPANGEF